MLGLKLNHVSKRGHSALAMAWWRHQMEKFSALLAICAGNTPVTGEFPAQRAVTRSFDVFFDLRLNKRLSKQWWGWWLGTPSRPLWRHCNWLLQSCAKPRDRYCPKNVSKLVTCVFMPSSSCLLLRRSVSSQIHGVLNGKRVRNFH